MHPPWVYSIIVVFHMHMSFHLIFHIFFLLLGLLHVMPPFFVILWGYMGPVPPSPSYTLSGCNTFTWLISLVHHASLSLSLLSWVWMSHPHLFCACHTLIVCFSFNVGELVLYLFPSNFIPRRSTDLTEFSLLDIVFVFPRFLVYTLLVSDVIFLLFSKCYSWPSMSMW